MKKSIFISCLLWATFSLYAQEHNVLLIIADDLGVDYMSTYNEGSDPAPTPNIDRLASAGVQFKNTWSNPVCSPTRAGILTGQYGFRNGIQYVVGGRNGGVGISTDKFTLPKAIRDSNSNHTNSCIGKWHLSDENNGNEDNPNIMGFDYYSGLLLGAFDYFNWSKTTNGNTIEVSNYSTTENVDDAIGWINQQTGPWFQWLAFMNPHTPFHLPPNDLHSFDNLSGSRRDIRRNPIPYFKASIEAMDTEVGRLIQYLKSTGQYENTNIIFVGDNGTTGQVVQAPFDSTRAKGTLYEGGVNVPMIITGPAVINGGRNSNALVNINDLFSTSLELMNIDLSQTAPSQTNIDAKSLLPILKSEQASVRDWVFTEIAGANDDVDGTAIRNSSYKLITFDSGIEEFYNLNTDPFENNNLLRQNISGNDLSNYNELKSQLASLINSETQNNLNSTRQFGLDEQPDIASESISIYPNPVDDQLNISISPDNLAPLFEEKSKMTFKIFDISGHTLKEGIFSSNVFSINTEKILKRSKLYFIEINTASGRRFVKRFYKK